MEHEAELKHFRAMELECSKWESREDRLVEQMHRLEHHLARLEVDSQKVPRRKVTEVEVNGSLG